MSKVLLNEEIKVLKILKNKPTVLTSEDYPVLTRLQIRGLADRNSQGEMVLTKNGERILFQRDCREALSALEQGISKEIKPGVKKWLKSSGFVTENQVSSVIIVTNRGRTWLASFDIEGPLDHLSLSQETLAGLGLRTRINDRRFQQ